MKEFLEEYSNTLDKTNTYDYYKNRASELRGLEKKISQYFNNHQ